MTGLRDELSNENQAQESRWYTIAMNKRTATIAYYGCFLAAVLIVCRAIGYAADLAYSGTQPIVWVNVLAFFGAVLLVVLAIIIKIKYNV